MVSKNRNSFVKPVKINHTKIVLSLLKGKLARKGKMFGGNPTEYFRKIRTSKK